ncbi:YggS family pyridoxal phosphate-dependent enzyme [Athalassotoga sp.]|uniref:YggS family pyridoxal phosphate-dependent enzyme n=1 Tax=Athalassotoga sp. TaxID=2022597 RepID=UPI003D022B61
MSISENVKKILSDLPHGVDLEVAAKSRNYDEIEESILAGAKIIGENYVQEAEKVIPLIKEKVEWHFIGSVQENKINKMIRLFDMIETIGSVEIAKILNKKCESTGKVMKILIEVNSGLEPQKAGVMPEMVEDAVKEISKLQNLKIYGLMTMGPALEAENLRPYFKLTKALFDHIKSLNFENVKMDVLSMGMSDSYLVAIEEGANLVRIGTKIFGPRNYSR